MSYFTLFPAFYFVSKKIGNSKQFFKYFLVFGILYMLTSLWKHKYTITLSGLLTSYNSNSSSCLSWVDSQLKRLITESAADSTILVTFVKYHIL